MEVPTISLAGYFGALENGQLSSPPSAELAALVDSIRQACEEVGFFTIVDHGIDAALLEAQRRECSAFFDRPPQSVVLGMLPPGAAGGRFRWLDYAPPSSEGDGASQSEASAGKNSATWSLGPMEGRGSMPWRPDTDEMTSTWLAYYDAMERLVAVLMQLFALALGLTPNAFDSALTGHRSSMRALLYPEVPEAELESAGGEVVRSGEHTDWGCVTVLLADPTVGGLEIRRKDGTLLPLQPPPTGLTVNLGDLLPLWTSGKWVATPHRVVARPESRDRRLSVPYFGLVNRSTVIRPLVSGRSVDESDSEDRPFTAGEFFDKHDEFMARYRSASSGRTQPKT